MIGKLGRSLSGLRAYVAGRDPYELARKGYRLLRREGLGGLRRLYLEMAGTSYSDWIRRHDTLTDDDRGAIRRHIDALSFHPTVSILMPVFDPPAEFLERAIASVRNQLYSHWELCIADDASTAAHVRPILERALAEDDRIRVHFRSINSHISAASNTALAMARGEFIALLDHDDELAEHALYHVVVALNENPDLDLLYSDEDKIDAKGRRFGHYFKPDWNPDLFLAQNLINHLGVYRRVIANVISGFREGLEGSQDWDFALRFVERTAPERIRHIPRVLYHWRAIPGSTAVGVAAKEYAAAAARSALLDCWRRRGIEADVAPAGSGHFHTRLPLPAPAPLVTVVICTRNRVELLRQCIDGLGRLTEYAPRELIIVDNGSDDSATLGYLAQLQDSGVARILRHDAPFNFAALNNLAVRHARGELICLLNNDVTPISPGWLRQMVGHGLRPEIGAVGAMLLYPDDSIQHGGVVLDGIAAGHLHLGYPRGTGGYGNRARLAQNFSAVTAACLVVRKSVWEEVDGMDESFAVAYNDVDFCLRVRERGYRNLWLPQVELYHHESASRGKEDTPAKRERFAAEVALLQRRWAELIAEDPAWNPNLARDGAHIRLAEPPRLAIPWRAFDV